VRFVRVSHYNPSANRGVSDGARLWPKIPHSVKIGAAFLGVISDEQRTRHR
jgi:hypothetical protein